MLSTDPFLQASIQEARQGLAEGGIPIGSVIVHRDKIIGRGHNRRVQKGSAILHGEMDALENAGRQSAAVYRESVLYTTLSPCSMCSGAILLYGMIEGLRFVGVVYNLVAVGLVIMVFVILLPRGLAGLRSTRGGRTVRADAAPPPWKGIGKEGLLEFKARKGGVPT